MSSIVFRQQVEGTVDLFYFLGGNQLRFAIVVKVIGVPFFHRTLVGLTDFLPGAARFNFKMSVTRAVRVICHVSNPTTSPGHGGPGSS